MIRVLVAEDHTIVREGIKQLIGRILSLKMIPIINAATKKRDRNTTPR